MAVAREEPRVLVRLVCSGRSRSVHLLELDKVVSQFIAKGRDLGLVLEMNSFRRI